MKTEELYSRLEQQFDKQKDLDDEKMELNRRKYLDKRSRVRQTIQREGYIDERLEYDYF